MYHVPWSLTLALAQLVILQLYRWQPIVIVYISVRVNIGKGGNVIAKVLLTFINDVTGVIISTVLNM